MTVYLDWNATTPPLDEVLEVMQHVARECWANPASVHAWGRRARHEVEKARACVGERVGADPRDVVFTSGGTEANNLALRSAFSSQTGMLVTSRLEHPSVTRVAEALEREGRAKIHWLRVTPEGSLDLDELQQVLANSQVRLVTVQAVNHETGVVLPVQEVLRLAHTRGVAVHVDAVQALGRVEEFGQGADTLCVASHKLRGPKGIGALVVSPQARTRGLELSALLLGGSQERGLRPGTLDPVAASGFGVAAGRSAGGPDRYAKLLPVHEAFERSLAALGLEVNGKGTRAPHVTNVWVRSWEGVELAAALDLEGVCVSSGSACSAGTSELSPVLSAMHGPERARQSIRISMGETTTWAEMELALEVLDRVLHRNNL
jgi:cysteine desulfurase